MLSIFLAFFINFLGYSGVSATAGGGLVDRAVVQTPAAPVHHVHTMDATGSPSG
jgi:hypothetical protein